MVDVYEVEVVSIKGITTRRGFGEDSVAAALAWFIKKDLDSMVDVVTLTANKCAGSSDG